ncbi:MAG TPA: Tat pathway signal sequence domain protein [Phenylobacterium sp.]|nr:Tat pathway signal sequence domain protein [Phenylobacterium sp.]
MRRSAVFAAVLLAAAATLPATEALAQGRRPSQEDKQQEEQAKKKKRNEEWGDSQAPLPQLRNAGPCPFVKVLYDAGRYVEFKGGKEASADVAYSGEIQGISAGCAYKDDQPITVQMEVLFELGKGPQAEGSSKTYRYWIAVTKRNQAIIDKKYFDLPVKFEPGQDRLYVTEQIGDVTIPRASLTTSGSNFEILVGFDVTPQMAEFNREGKRFRLTAGSTVQPGTPTQK